MKRSHIEDSNRRSAERSESQEPPLSRPRNTEATPIAQPKIDATKAAQETEEDIGVVAADEFVASDEAIPSSAKIKQEFAAKKAEPLDITITGAAAAAASPKTKQSITFFGSGQVTALMAGLIAIKNRDLPDESKINISILGNEGSDSLKAMQEHGIRLTMADGKVEEIKPEEFFAITDNPEDLKNQDHVFVTLKTTAYETKESCTAIVAKINSMKKPENITPSDNRTTVTLAQNGIPCWFMHSIGHPDIILDSIGASQILLNGIGVENMVGCVLNLACGVESKPDGTPDYGKYKVTTPKDAINVPISFVTEDSRRNLITSQKNLRNLQEILRSSGITVQKRSGDLLEDLMRKIQVNIALNGLSAITGLSTEKMLEDPKLVKVMEALSMQVLNIAKKHPIDVTLRDRAELIERIRLNQKHITSMGLDANFGKKLEIGAIFESLVEIEKKLALRTSTNVIESLIKVLHSLTKKMKEGKPITVCREEISKELEELKNSVDMNLAPPSPRAAQRSLAASGAGGYAASPLRRNGISPQPGYNSSSSGDYESEKPDINNYESLVFETNEKETFKLTIKPKIEIETDSRADQIMMKSLCRNFKKHYKGQPGFKTTYTDPDGVEQESIYYNDSCINIADKETFDKFRTWCESNKNLKVHSHLEGSRKEGASIGARK